MIKIDCRFSMVIKRSTFTWSLLSMVASPFVTLAKQSQEATTLLSRVSPLPHPAVQRLEQSARLVMLGQDESISEMADAVLTFPHVIKLPDTHKQLLQGRLSSAEVSYSQGRLLGVHETDLASTLNQMSDIFALPSFARVSQHQLRALRVRLLGTSAVFMGRGVTTAAAKPGDSINPHMSPLQATHLALVMVDQKILNSEFQYEVDEWEQQHEIQQAARRQQANSSLLSGRTSDPSYKAFSMNAKGKDLLQAINTNTKNVDMETSARLVAESFAGLGLLQFY